ncbi:MAG: hypothetical protein PUC23_05240, partial [bacterium]|nr:hypothetical protein [bacterium]
SNIEKEQIDDGYKYIIEITSGEISTIGNVKLKENVIQDINGNYNKESNVSDDINVVTFPVYTYTGSHQFIDDGDGNWRIKFLTSGTFTLTSSDLNIDIFLVGGGGAGTYGEINYSSGGGGGYTKTIKNVNIAKDSSHSIIIGAGAQRNASYTTATGKPSYFDSYLANGGKSGAHQAGGNGGSGGGGGRLSTGGSDGGNGIRGGYSFTQGSGQGTTTREFGEAGGDIYSGGGGGGGGTNQSGGAGGAGGGGNGGKGGSESSCGNGGNGGSGTSNTGGGGGGGGKGPCTNSEDGLGGSGGSGIVIIRNAR